MSDLNGTLKERAREEADGFYVTHGYHTLDDEGLPVISKQMAAEVLFGPISTAVATTPKERDQVCISREALVKIAFPQVPGRDGWGSEDDPDLAKATWEALDSDVWRLVNDGPEGLVQEMLNTRSGLALIKRSGTRRLAANVYATADPACMMDDVIVPKNAVRVRRDAADARHVALLMRVAPEAAKKFDRELSRGLNQAKNDALAITAQTLAVITAGDAEDAGE